MLETCMRTVEAGRIVLHSDNGGPMKGSTMLATLQRLGVVPSFSRPGVSDDNPFSEALFRTLKYRPEYPRKPFSTIAQARLWVAGFVAWYNNVHRHSSIRFVTPEQRHQGHDVAVLARRAQLYEQARRRRPERWARGTRNWTPAGAVYLNPQKRGDTDAPCALLSSHHDRQLRDNYLDTHRQQTWVGSLQQTWVGSLMVALAAQLWKT